MGVWTFFSYSSTTQTVAETDGSQLKTLEAGIVSADPESALQHTPEPHSGAPAARPTSITTQSEIKSTTIVFETSPERPPAPAKRFSFKNLSFSRKPQDEKPVLSAAQEKGRRDEAVEAAAKRLKQRRLSRSDKRAKKNALRLRLMITGEPTGAAPQLSPVVAKPQMNKLKSQLLEPKSANKLIAELRRLPATDSSRASLHSAPIHAVCLKHTDAEEDSLHFAALRVQQVSVDNGNRGVDGKAVSFRVIRTSAVSTPLDKLTAMLNEMSVVDLVRTPDLGFGQPGDGEGLLAGAVPTAETVLNGVKQITPQLMALGYATGHAILPNHKGIYPPTDRLSVLTYWWGLEVLLPPPTLEYLANVQSITGTIVNFLSALALVNNGVREILPFIRYIAQYIDFEFNSIKRQDKGRGVVCAATWIMPAALVPRPWDFPEPPSNEGKQPAEGASSSVPNKAKKSTSAPSLPKPRPMSSMLDLVANPSLNPERRGSGSFRVPVPVVSVEA